MPVKVASHHTQVYSYTGSALRRLNRAMALSCPWQTSSNLPMTETSEDCGDLVGQTGSRMSV